MCYPAARFGDMHTCPLVNPSGNPHVGGTVIGPCSSNVITEGMPATRLADKAICAGPLDVIAGGAAKVLINGLPAVRLGVDMTVHGGVITSPGASLVLIGGPAFALPSNFVIRGDPDFQNKLIRDLYFLSTTRSGREVIDRLARSGQTITFVRTNDSNGYCSPENSSRASSHQPTGSTIQYNPDYRSNAYDSSGNLIAQPPQVILEHEMCHAVHNAEGTHAYGTDPSPPPSEPTINEEEAQTIGVGSHSGDRPSENTLRDDLGLPRRADHYGTGGSHAGEPAPLNLRPGD